MQNDAIVKNIHNDIVRGHRKFDLAVISLVVKSFNLIF